MVLIHFEKQQLIINIIIFPERSSCLGGKKLQDGKCPDFQCIDHSSCNGNGNCSSDQKFCKCDVGFSGTDCSINLKGKKFQQYEALNMFDSK